MSIPSHRHAPLHSGNSVARHSYYYLLSEEIPEETKLLMVALDLLPLKKGDHFDFLDAMAKGGEDNDALDKMRGIVSAPVLLERGKWYNIALIAGKTPRIFNQLRAQWVGDSMKELGLPHNSSLLLDPYDINVSVYFPSSQVYDFALRYSNDVAFLEGTLQKRSKELLHTTPDGWELTQGVEPFLGRLLKWLPTPGYQGNHALGIQRGLIELGRGHPLGEARIQSAMEHITTDNPILVKEIVEAGLAVDQKKVHSFLDLVQEYNVEWALASFEWS